MYRDVYNMKQYLDIEMYTTCNNRQIERYLDRKVEEVGTGRCIHHVTIHRQRDNQIERCIEMYTTCNNRLIERYLDRKVEEVGTGRCIQHVTIN